MVIIRFLWSAILLTFVISITAAEPPLPKPATVPIIAKSKNLPNLEVEAERKTGIYHQGENICFKVGGNNLPDNAVINYTIQFNNAEILQTGTVKPHETVIVKADKPGFIDITLKYQGLNADAAVGIDPQLLRPSMPCPEDFQQFWTRKLAELAAVPMNLQLKKIAAPSAEAYQEWNGKWPVFADFPLRYKDIDVFDFTANAAGSDKVRGYLAIPAGAAPKSLPAILFTHGAGIGDSDLLKPYVAARLGFIAMDINAHGLLNGQPKQYYDTIAKEIKDKYGSFWKKDVLDKNTMYIVNLYLRHRRALDILCSRPEWNGRVLIVRGASQGGALALACAGLDNRVTAICAGVPAFCDTTSKFSLKGYFSTNQNDEKNINKIKDSVRYVSLANFMPHIKAEAYFTVAFRDRSCHPSDIYAAYNLYSGPKKIYTATTAGHSEVPRAIQYSDYTKFTLDHIEKMSFQN